MQWGELIGQAYRIALHNRRLWPFGVFAGTTGGFNFSFQYSGDGGGDSPDTSGDSFDPDPDLIIAIVLIVLVVVVVAALMAVISQGALARSVAAIARGEQRGSGRRCARARARSAPCWACWCWPCCWESRCCWLWPSRSGAWRRPRSR